jgi:toxin ParE1/3/4
MAYLVEMTARAARDLEILYLTKNAAESREAARWYNGLEEAVSSLTTHPHRCPVAPETRRTKRQLRHLLYGKKPHVYRVIFEVQEQLQTVWVLTIRHAAMRKAATDQL